VARVIWTPAALRDLARLHGFLAPKNRDAARRAISAIRQGVKLLTAHPEIGRPVEAMPAGFREWPIRFGDGGYVVLYRYDGDVVVTLAVRHGREAGYQSALELPG
jgi:plasmid stabilization system protein ParE